MIYLLNFSKCFQYGLKRKDEIEAEEKANRERETVGRLGRTKSQCREDEPEDEGGKIYKNSNKLNHRCKI